MRDTAAECINICINLISERESASKQGFLNLIYEEVKKAFSDNDPNYQHSALTVLSALLSSKGTASEILQVTSFSIYASIVLRHFHY